MNCGFVSCNVATPGDAGAVAALRLCAYDARFAIYLVMFCIRSVCVPFALLHERTACYSYRF